MAETSNGFPDVSKSSFSARMPSAYRQLTEVGAISETYFHDACEIEFVVEDGQFFVCNTRPVIRTPVANIRLALEFLMEGSITPQEVLRRIAPRDVAAWVAPAIQNKHAMRILGNGLPAYAGATTGRVVFQPSEVLKLAANNIPSILIMDDISLFDLQHIAHAQGVLTIRGGLSSHAAIASRIIQRPCVVGYKPKFGDAFPAGNVSSLFTEGGWITIDGTFGEVFEGKGKCDTPNWRDQPELVILAEILRYATFTGDLPMEIVGQAWKINDYFLHSTPLIRRFSNKMPVVRSSYTSFIPPSLKSLAGVRQNLTHLRPEEIRNYREILLSLIDVLLRLLSSAVGIGNHPKYFRPLWDPQNCIETIERESVQLIGMQFFGVNQHIEHFPDVATITIFLEVVIEEEGNGWFLDFTNPSGESLVMSSELVRAYTLFVNGAKVHHKDLPMFYHCIRRREYTWQFYEENLTTRSAIIEALKAWDSKKSADSHILALCYELGLIRNGELTLAGHSLLGKTIQNGKV